jgi:hypothetical protein
MPIPKPHSNEEENAFISRCISELYNEYGQESSAAICYSTWREKDNMSEIDFATLPTTDCIEKHKSLGYNEKDAKQACSAFKPVPEDEQQGGVVGFARVKFEYPPKAKEKMNDFMARCMADDMVREKKPNRSMRGGFCWSEYQNNYVMSIGSRWK